MTNYQKDPTAKTTIWRRTNDGLKLIKTVPGLPYGTAQTVRIEGFGNATLTGRNGVIGPAS